jgi:hypothetical protein
MPVTAIFLWYLVVAGPQGGLAVLPSPFDQSEQCRAAISEFEKTNPPSKWNLQCFPAGPALDEGQMPDDASPEGQPQ